VKELMTSLLALSIAGVTLGLLVAAFASAGATGSSAVDAFNRKKDVLLLALPVLGTILGYYFGRVPAERRAEQAEQTATGAQEQVVATQNARAKAEAGQAAAEQQTAQIRNDGLTTAGRLRDALEGGLGPTLGDTAGAAAPDTARAMAELDAWESRLQALGSSTSAS
jgi:hypothetical protein